jgi:sigma-B regulation protein RsbU (phosphoserine phosphatase)
MRDLPFDLLERPLETDSERSPRPAGERALDPRSLPLYTVYRRFRHLALTDPSSGRPEGLGRLLLSAVAAEHGSDSPIVGVWLFRRFGSRLELEESNEPAGAARFPRRLFLDQPWLADALRERTALLVPERRTADAPEIAAGGVIALLPLGAERDVFVVLQLAEPLDRTAAQQALFALRAFAQSILERPSAAGWLEQALTVQTSLLPETVPDLAGFELEVRSRPAQIVGGDVFDFPRSAPESVGLLIADACGHGLPAALQARDAIIGVRMGAAHGLRMDATLATLSRLIACAGGDRRFVSLFLGELDLDGNLLYVNAGHVSPWLLRADGSMLPLASTGRVLGLATEEPARYHRRHVQLRHGDLFVAYTDGITEVETAPGEEWGAAGLTALVLSMADRPLAVIADEVFSAVDALTFGGPPDDDQTLLLVRRQHRSAAD